jgi:lipopolysaccharide assembly protein A
MTTTEQPAQSRGSRVREFFRRKWIAIVLIIVAVVFIVQNRKQVTIELFTVQVSTSQWMILGIVFVLGVISGYLMGRRRRRRRPQT